MKQHSEEEVASFDISRKLATLANIPEFHNYCEYFWIQDHRFEEEPDRLKLIPSKLVPVYTMKADPEATLIFPAPTMAEVIKVLGMLFPESNYSINCNFTNKGNRFQCNFKIAGGNNTITGESNRKVVDSIANVLLSIISDIKLKQEQEELQPATP